MESKCACPRGPPTTGGSEWGEPSGDFSLGCFGIVSLIMSL